MVPSPRMQAADVARSLAKELGFADAEPVVVAEGTNLVLRIGPVVARVAIPSMAGRAGSTWLRREVEISRFLATRGVGVTRPIAGPFERDGIVLSFWEAEDVQGAPDPRTAGIELRRAHAALADYAGELPLWGGVEEARQRVPLAQRAMSEAEHTALARAWDRVERIIADARGRSASFQPVHGDAHIGNVLSTSRGVLWTDWEDAFIGPVEFDLACLKLGAELFGHERATVDAIAAGYGEAHHELVRDLVLVRNVQTIAWFGLFADDDPALLLRMRAHIAKLP